MSSMDSATADKCRRLSASKEIQNKLSGNIADNHNKTSHFTTITIWSKAFLISSI